MTAKPRKSRPRKSLEMRTPATVCSVLDRTLVLVSPESFDTFLALLDAPAQPNPRLRRTLQTAPPWPEA